VEVGRSGLFKKLSTGFRKRDIHDVEAKRLGDDLLEITPKNDLQPGEYLIRTPLKELAAQLDPTVFWQVHRGTLVRATAIASAERDEAGRLYLHLRDRPERLAVSRLYAPLFKAM
jgi:hypothetical protein